MTGCYPLMYYKKYQETAHYMRLWGQFPRPNQSPLWCGGWTGGTCYGMYKPLPYYKIFIPAPDR